MPNWVLLLALEAGFKRAADAPVSRLTQTTLQATPSRATLSGALFVSYPEVALDFEVSHNISNHDGARIRFAPSQLAKTGKENDSPAKNATIPQVIASVPSSAPRPSIVEGLLLRIHMAPTPRISKAVSGAKGTRTTGVPAAADSATRYRRDHC